MDEKGKGGSFFVVGVREREGAEVGDDEMELERTPYVLKLTLAHWHAFRGSCPFLLFFIKQRS